MGGGNEIWGGITGMGRGGIGLEEAISAWDRDGGWAERGIVRWDEM